MSECGHYREHRERENRDYRERERETERKGERDKVFSMVPFPFLFYIRTNPQTLTYKQREREIENHITQYPQKYTEEKEKRKDEKSASSLPFFTAFTVTSAVRKTYARE